ncbi:MAG TPA: hypothetical protein VFE31_01795 [Opitutaceae bacterium]|jgi:hypothetical protein|nr:hypothetical protein [Opitutaceae bacterium]
MHRRIALIAALALLAAGLTACTRTDPFDDPIAAGSSIDYLLWRAHETKRLSPVQWQWFDEAVEDLRLELMNEGKLHGAAQLNDAVLAEMDGQTVRKIMLVGITHRIARMRLERDQLSFTLRSNAALATYRGDTVSAGYLADMQRSQLKRRDDDVADISQDHVILAELGTPDRVADSAAPLVLPDRPTVERPDRMPRPPPPIVDSRRPEAPPSPPFRILGLPPMRLIQGSAEAAPAQPSSSSELDSVPQLLGNGRPPAGSAGAPP